MNTNKAQKIINSIYEAANEYVLHVYDIDYDVDRSDILEYASVLSSRFAALKLGISEKEYRTMSSAEKNRKFCEALDNGSLSVNEVLDIPSELNFCPTGLHCWTDEEIADYISDMTGFCVLRYRKEAMMDRKKAEKLMEDIKELKNELDDSLAWLSAWTELPERR